MKNIVGMVVGMVLLLTACTTDGYETGDGEYSFLTTEFVEVYSNSQSMLTRAVDDSDNHFIFKVPCSYSWVSKPDSVYRAILYYNTNEGETVEPYRVSPVVVLKLRNKEEVKDIYTDPLIFESAWISKNRKYLNIGLAVKSGTTESQDEQLKQIVGILCDEVTIKGDGTKCYHLILTHNQNGVPEYYTNRAYVSMPLDGVGANDEIELTINTYQGPVTIRR